MTARRSTIGAAFSQTLTRRPRAVSGLLCLAIVAAALWGAGGSVSAASPQPSPSEIGLQASDVPQFTAINPSIESFRNATFGTDQAFIEGLVGSCARLTPLISYFDESGHESTVSVVYGSSQTTGPFPTLSAATAVFTDGSVADAHTASATLADTSFQRCWASDIDVQAGPTTPVTPTTVTALPTPSYGQGTVAFDLHRYVIATFYGHTGDLEVTAIWQGSVVAMLLTQALDTPFPDAMRLSILAGIAKRMNAVEHSTVLQSTSTQSICMAPASASWQPLLTDAEVNAAVGTSLPFAGWANDFTGDFADGSRDCDWDGPLSPGGLPDPGLEVTVTAPFPIGGAQSWYDTSLTGGTEPPQPVLGVGEAAFWSGPAYGVGAGLTALAGNRLVFVSLSAPQGALPQAKQAVLTLSQLVVGRLGGSAPIGVNASCLAQIVLGDGPGWVQSLNAATTKGDQSSQGGLPVSIDLIPTPDATIDFSGAISLQMAPSLDPGAFNFCADGSTLGGSGASYRLQPLWQTRGSDSLDLAISETNGAHFGPFVYSADLATWTQVDPNVTPPGQDLVTCFTCEAITPQWEADPNFVLSLSKDDLSADLTVGKLVVPSSFQGVRLVVSGGGDVSVLDYSNLVLEFTVEKGDLLDDLAKLIKEDPEAATDPEKAEAKAVTEEATQIEDAAQGEVEEVEEGWYGAARSAAETVAKTVASNLQESLISEFTTWLNNLSPADAGDLAQEVPPDELPPDIAAVVDAEASAEFTDTIVELCEEVCAAAAAA